jgi:hypothetical protein
VTASSGSAAGLAPRLAISAWVLFDRGSAVVLSLAFMTVLLLIAVPLPWILSEVLAQNTGWHRKDICSRLPFGD